MGEQWVISVEEKLNKAKQFVKEQPWKKWSIYRVSKLLKNAQDDPKVYGPQTLSIGPYHHGSEQLRDTDFLKWVVFQQILDRNGQNLDYYLDGVREYEEAARSCYEHQFKHMSSNDFVMMMVVDGCFILELFRCYLEDSENSLPIFTNRGMVNNILVDMVLLENQIPLLVLDKLYQLMHKNGKHEQLIGSILNLFNSEWLTGIPDSDDEFIKLRSLLQQQSCLHILDVFRRSLLNPKHQLGATISLAQERQFTHNVSDLRKGGIKFKRSSSKYLWDIEFKNGTVIIPRIQVHDSTVTILLNLAAFEQCHLKQSESVVSSYIVFMQCLLKVPEDVSHLHDCGIIEHVLGTNNEVVDMFRNASKEIAVDADGGLYATLSREINGYYSRRRNKWRASLVQDYCSNPWVIISFVVAVILLLLTGVQSFYSVLAYHKPPAG